MKLNKNLVILIFAANLATGLFGMEEPSPKRQKKEELEEEITQQEETINSKNLVILGSIKFGISWRWAKSKELSEIINPESDMILKSLTKSVTDSNLLDTNIKSTLLDIIDQLNTEIHQLEQSISQLPQVVNNLNLVKNEFEVYQNVQLSLTTIENQINSLQFDEDIKESFYVVLLDLRELISALLCYITLVNYFSQE